MKNKLPLSLLIRADASKSIGTGHVMRCIALGQAWKANGGNVLFVSHCESNGLRDRLTAEGFNFIPIREPHPHSSDIDDTIAILEGIRAKDEREATLVALDGYHFQGNYQRIIKQKGFRLLCIDDYCHVDQYYADVILNQNISADRSLYQNCPSHTMFLLGSRYALLRSEFVSWNTWQRDIPSVAKKVLVTMGGSDPDNATLKVVQALKGISIPDLEVSVLLGPANSHKHEIEHALNLAPFESRLLLSVNNMSEIMAWADVAIAAGGSTSWELAFMGLPNLSLILAENQQTVSESLEAAGISINLGWYDKVNINAMTNAIENLMKNESAREVMSGKGRGLINGNGSSEVARSLMDTHITFRPVRQEDCRIVWEWANDPDTRVASFSEDPISWENHIRWFAEKLNDPEHIFFILLRFDGMPVGQVRYAVNDREAVISMSISPKFRGQGFGSQGIRMTAEELFRSNDIDVIRAYIKPENIKSVKAFTRAGFRENKSQVVGRGHNRGQIFFICRDDVL